MRSSSSILCPSNPQHLQILAIAMDGLNQAGLPPAGRGSVEALSEVLNMASWLAEANLTSLSMFAVICMVPFVFVYFLLLKGQGKMAKQLHQLSNDMQTLRDLAQVSSDDVQSLNNMVQGLQGTAIQGLPSNADASADSTVFQCIDAKLLDIATQAGALQRLLGSLDAQQTVARLEEIQDLLQNNRVTQDQLLSSMAVLPPKLTEVVAKVSPLAAGQQSLTLDVKKSFAAADTQADGLLKQSQDNLKCLQAEAKELKDKLIKIETVSDGIASACKQLSLDIHVSRTKQEQKMDGFLTDFKQFAGQTNSSLRGFGPLMPGLKTTHDHLNNAIDYLATAFKTDERVEAVLHNMQEQVNNIEDRLLRLESLLVGVNDLCNENTDVGQQLKESLNMLHDNVGNVLERLPKLPKRSPPSQEAPPPAATQPAPAPAPAQSSTDAGIPLRLSEHLMPVQRAQEPIRFEIRSAANSQLQHVPTDELLRVLLTRQQFH